MKSTNVQTCGMIRFNMIWTFFHRHFFPTCQNLFFFSGHYWPRKRCPSSSVKTRDRRGNCLNSWLHPWLMKLLFKMIFSRFSRNDFLSQKFESQTRSICFFLSKYTSPAIVAKKNYIMVNFSLCSWITRFDLLLVW
jgi:hypothetical protein